MCLFVFLSTLSLHKVGFSYNLSSLVTFKASLLTQAVRICLKCGRHGFDPWGGKIPLEEGIVTPSRILAWRIPMDRGAWWARVHAVKELDMTEQLSTAESPSG